MTKIYFKLDYEGKKVELISDNMDRLENYLFRVYGLSVDAVLFSKSEMVLSHVETVKKYYPYISEVSCV